MIPRRQFLQNSTAASLFYLLPVSLSCSKKRLSSGTLYLNSILDILKKIRSKEPDSIRDASNIFADTIISRNRCFIYTADSPVAAYLSESLTGLPPVFVPLRSEAMAETVRDGDALLTTSTGEIPETAGEKAAHIVGITSPSVFYGRGDNNPEKLTDNSPLRNISDVLIHSYLPERDGLVKLPEYHPSGILPGSVPALLAVITAVAGETYRRSGGIGLTGSSPPEDALSFLDILLERIGRLDDFKEKTSKAGDLAAERIHEHGRLWIYNARGTPGKEIAGSRAGVPLFAQSITRERISGGTLRTGDVLVFSAIRSNDPDDLNVMRMARKITGNIISLCPHEKTGGYRIFKESAASLDNLSYETDGILTFDNGTRRFMTTGAIINSVLLWYLLGETADRLIRAGEIPSFSG